MPRNRHAIVMICEVTSQFRPMTVLVLRTRYIVKSTDVAKNDLNGRTVLVSSNQGSADCPEEFLC